MNKERSFITRVPVNYKKDSEKEKQDISSEFHNEENQYSPINKDNQLNLIRGNSKTSNNSNNHINNQYIMKNPSNIRNMNDISNDMKEDQKSAEMTSGLKNDNNIYKRSNIIIFNKLYSKLFQRQ